MSDIIFTCFQIHMRQEPVTALSCPTIYPYYR